MSPTFDAGRPVTVGLGWGCSCPSFRTGEPDPETALKRLAGSELVTVEYLGEYPDGLRFTAWTEVDKEYAVTFGEGGRGGWCKHITSCMSHFLPWHHQLAVGASDALEKIEQQGKEIRKLERKIARLEKRG